LPTPPAKRQQERTWNWDDIIALSQQPSEGELTRSAAFLGRKILEELDELEVLFKVLERRAHS
jgi:hypothetical protein